MKWALFAILALIVAIGGCSIYADHQRFLAWTAQRDSWHERCDRYVEKTPAQLASELPAANACKDEFLAMLEYAKSQGWEK